MVMKILRLFYFYRLKFLLYRAQKNNQLKDPFDLIMFKIRHTPRKLFEDYVTPKDIFDHNFIRIGFRDPAHYVRVGDKLCDIILNGNYVEDTKLLEHSLNQKDISFDKWLCEGETSVYRPEDMVIYIFTIVEHMQQALSKHKDNKEMYPYYQRKITGFMQETRDILRALLTVAYNNE